MRLLIVEDSKIKIEWIRDILKEKNIKYDEITYLNGAYVKILDSPDVYDGIILDMQFPLYQDGEIEGSAGEKLLKRLKNKKINIPVLGNSSIEFPSLTEYPCLRGNTYGVFEPKVLNDFLESL